MKKLIELLPFFAFLILGTSLNAQKPDKTPVKIFEKVYLHIDRQLYSSGDDIWFKAYLVNAKTNRLIDNSNNLYVELISPDSRILKRLAIRVRNGLGFGDFHLRDSLPTGNYIVRAYTNWMRNFGETFFFEREIRIENFAERNNNSKAKPAGENVDVQFFPEGGAMLEETFCRIGFKAVDSRGYGCNISGKIVSSEGDTVVSFKSSHLGMGSCYFTPKKGVSYAAVGKADLGLGFRVNLPEATKKGFAIEVSEKDSLVLVKIRTNPETLRHDSLKAMYVIVSAKGKIHAAEIVKISGLQQDLSFSKRNLPEGIDRLTLVDTTGKAFCERLFYCEHPALYQITVVPDNKVYAPRQLVNLKISVKDTANSPVFANLSMSVTDGTQTISNHYGSDINSYFMLESELRGNIEQPSYYFDPAVKDRQQALDQLLLTQGWRKFVWNFLADTSIKITYPAEQGITVSGRLRRLFADSPIAGANVNLSVLGRNSQFFLTQTDSSGRYYFDGLNFTGGNSLVITSNINNKKHNGMVLLDSLFGTPPLVSFRQNIRDELHVKENEELVAASGQNYFLRKKYHLTDTIALNEVVVEARRQKKDDGHIRIYGEPDYSLTVTDDMIVYNDFLDMLMGRVSGVRIDGNFPDYQIYIRGEQTNLFLLDGIPKKLEDIVIIPVEEIDKIEVIKDEAKLAAFGSRGAGGAISVFRKKGQVIKPKPVLYSINKRINGYYQARTFYSPKYDVVKPESEKPDLRSTIYWEPNVNTDYSGEAKVSYYNADNNAVIHVRLEGLTEAGIPIVGKATYEVRQK